MEANDAIRWVARPDLDSPVLVAAFEGWNDAGEAASGACSFLASAWGATEVASLDPEEFYDFTVARPHVTLDDEGIRVIEWPANRFSWAEPEGGRSVIFLQGVEPQLRWRTFTEAVAAVAHALDVSLVLTLGALLTDSPHTKPVKVTGTAGSRDLIERLDLSRSQYEGPTGIVGVLHDALRREGIESASLWAAVPHYVGQNPAPKATLALVERVARILETDVATTPLELAAASWEQQVTDAVAADDEMTEYVRRLEEAGDDPEIPPRDELAAEVERFLRDQGQ